MATEVVNSRTSAAKEEPAPYRFSVEQYHGMIESRILTQDDRVQMLEGAIVEMTPIGPRHRVSVTRLNDLLAKILPKDWHIACQQPITLSASEPEPDLSIVRGQLFEYLDRLPVESDVGLVIEVADHTIEFDRTRKGAVYAAAGIPEYWIVNLNEKNVEIYRDPQPPAAGQPAWYESKQVLGQSQSLTLMLDGKNFGDLRISKFLP